ncbi:MAG: hypothetical protein HKP13_01815, partial [Gammaproteobacteria bacterium]|nr:hypothetical protein [Gammaproteobacteria bacterium]
GDDLLGIECKRTDTPRMTPSIRHALDALGLKNVIVLYPGTKRFPITERVTAVPIQAVAEGACLI